MGTQNQNRDPTTRRVSDCSLICCGYQKKLSCKLAIILKKEYDWDFFNSKWYSNIQMIWNCNFWRNLIFFQLCTCQRLCLHTFSFKCLNTWFQGSRAGNVLEPSRTQTWHQVQMTQIYSNPLNFFVSPCPGYPCC